MWSSQDHWPIFFCDFILFRTLLVAPSPAVTRLAVDPRAGRLFVAAHTRTRTSQPKVIYIPIFPFSSWGWSFLNLLHSNTHCIGLYRAQFTFTPWVECRWICWMPRLGLSLVSPWIQSNRYSSSSSVSKWIICNSRLCFQDGVLVGRNKHGSTPLLLQWNWLWGCWYLPADAAFRCSLIPYILDALLIQVL